MLCRSMTTGDWIYRLSRWSLGAVFIYAGATKLAAPANLAVLMQAFGLVPENVLLPLAIALPILEIVSGVGLVWDIRGSLASITGLLAVFIAILAYALWMGLDVDCGCFGPGDPEAAAYHGLRAALYRDLIMLAAAFFIYAWRRLRTIRPTTVRCLIKKSA